jgi:hypothetical protein
MPLINTADRLYIGTAAAAAAYKNGDRVWPPDSGVSTVTATLAQTTAPTVRLTISHTGEVPVLFKLYRTTATAWTFWKDVAVGGAYDYTTTYSTTISMKVEAYYSDGSAIIAYSNPVAVGPAPPPAQVAQVFEANSVEWASFNKNGRRTDATSCYYGNVSTTHGNQYSQVRWTWPANIRAAGGCISIQKVLLRWYNQHHFNGDPNNTVSMKAHHNSTLAGGYRGATQVLLSGGSQVKWRAPKPGYIGNIAANGWIDLTALTSSGRYAIRDEIRVYGMQGFELWPAESGTAGYGYAATSARIRVEYTVSG